LIGQRPLLARFNDDDGLEVLISQCASCRHWNAKEGTRCAAYPDGIPYEIIVNDVSHTSPRDGDHDIQYEAK